MWTRPPRYERLTWPEVRQAAGDDRVALIPVATLEDHGPHLPIDADLRIVAEICRRAAEQAPDEIVLLPPSRTATRHTTWTSPGRSRSAGTRSPATAPTSAAPSPHHGFRRMLLLNGHGSNQNLVEMAARLVMVEQPEVARRGRLLPDQRRGRAQ